MMENDRMSETHRVAFVLDARLARRTACIDRSTELAEFAIGERARFAAQNETESFVGRRDIAANLRACVRQSRFVNRERKELTLSLGILHSPILLQTSGELQVAPILPQFLSFCVIACYQLSGQACFGRDHER